MTLANGAEVVKVTWLDSGMAMSSGWRSVKEYVADATQPHIMEASTVGYLAYENEDILLIAQTLDIGNETMLNAQVIARDAVIERIILT